MSNGSTRSPIHHDHDTTSARVLGPSRSGRLFVIGAAATILVIGAVLFLVFRDWRARHHELAAFGAREVATQVDALAGVVPPDVAPAVWTRAVADTHAMLESLTASGLMDRPAMVRLRADLQARFAATTPATARGDLAQLWDDMQARAGPVISGRSSRPPYSPSRPEILGKTPGG